MPEDWYRNTRWSPKVEAAFFDRLGRARSQRDQYLVIQALSLVPTHPDTTLRLVELYFESRTDDFHDVRALLARANAHLALGRVSVAIEAYKSVLDCERLSPGTVTNTEVDLPYLIAERGVSAEYDEALSLLHGMKEPPAFPVQRFKRHAALALIHAAKGNQEPALRHARLALEEAAARHSEFRFHRLLGLVGSPYRKTIRRLEKLAG